MYRVPSPHHLYVTEHQVQLLGSASAASTEYLVYAWQALEMPVGVNSVNIVGSYTLAPRFTPTMAGRYL